MSAWINITEDDLRVGKASALVDAFKSAALGLGQEDPTEPVIANICARIRSEIQSGGKIRVSATELSIPPSLRDLAIRMILWVCQSRINIRNAMPPSDQDVTDHRSDERYLERIAKGEVTVETPDDPQAPVEVQSTVGAPSISVPAREFNRGASDGI